MFSFRNLVISEIPILNQHSDFKIQIYDSWNVAEVSIYLDLVLGRFAISAAPQHSFFFHRMTILCSCTGSVSCQCSPQRNGDSLPIPRQRPILICNGAGSRTSATVMVLVLAPLAPVCSQFKGSPVPFLAYLPCQLSNVGKGQYWCRMRRLLPVS